VLPWNLENKDVVLTTSDAEVVTVDSNGNVIAVGAGQATVTATTVAAPYLFATCQITVENINDVSLNGMLYNAEEQIEWMSFNLLDAENWTSNFVESKMQFLAGGQHGDVLYVHDGTNMYGVNADTFEVTNYGLVHETWQWSDATTGPLTPAGYFDRLVGIISDGLSIGVMDVESGMGYEVPHYSEFTTDKAALIAYVGPTTYHNGFELCYGHEYYILSENGNLYHDILYAFYDKDAGDIFYDDKLTLVGETGLNLKGAANVRSDVKASMYYDLANDYLIVSAYTEGDSASVYVFQPDACAPVEVGSFGDGFWPVISLYSYDALTDVTVKVKPGQASCYVGETIQLTATVYMAEYDRTVTWSSSDESIATVNSNGVVTALKAGTVTITATSKEANEAHQLVSASATITVKPLAEVDVMLHAYVQTEDCRQTQRLRCRNRIYTKIVYGTAQNCIFGFALVQRQTVCQTSVQINQRISHSDLPHFNSMKESHHLFLDDKLTGSMPFDILYNRFFILRIAEVSHIINGSLNASAPVLEGFSALGGSALILLIDCREKREAHLSFQVGDRPRSFKQGQFPVSGRFTLGIKGNAINGDSLAVIFAHIVTAQKGSSPSEGRSV
jgi:uncharacterized protein YjdB